MGWRGSSTPGGGEPCPRCKAEQQQRKAGSSAQGSALHQETAAQACSQAGQLRGCLCFIRLLGDTSSLPPPGAPNSSRVRLPPAAGGAASAAPAAAAAARIVGSGGGRGGLHGVLVETLEPKRLWIQLEQPWAWGPVGVGWMG